MLFSVFNLCLLAQSEPAARRTADASTDPHYKLIFQNEYTRVHLLKLAKGEHSQFMVPNSFIRISLDDSTVAFSSDKSAGAEVVKKAMADFLDKGGKQYVENQGDGRYRAVIVELLKNKLNTHFPGQFPILGQLPPAPASVNADPVDLGGANVLGLCIAPEEFTKWHVHQFPHLIVAVTDLHLVNETKGKPSTTFKLDDGEVSWVPALATKHRIGNTEKAHPEDPMKKAEREQEREAETEVEGAAMYYTIEFK